MKTDIIKHNEDCDAEYFLCAWFDIDSLPKRRMILDAKEICELMEEYHRQKPKSKMAEITDDDIDEHFTGYKWLLYDKKSLKRGAKAFRDGEIKHT